MPKASGHAAMTTRVNQKDQPPVYLCHCEERSDVAIRSLSDPEGVGRCFAPQGMRIATSGFALLAMTVVDGGWSLCLRYGNYGDIAGDS